jgi:hypothetical protein
MAAGKRLVATDSGQSSCDLALMLSPERIHCDLCVRLGRIVAPFDRAASILSARCGRMTDGGRAVPTD